MEDNSSRLLDFLRYDEKKDNNDDLSSDKATRPIDRSKYEEYVRNNSYVGFDDYSKEIGVKILY